MFDPNWQGVPGYRLWLEFFEGYRTGHRVERVGPFAGLTICAGFDAWPWINGFQASSVDVARFSGDGWVIDKTLRPQSLPGVQSIRVTAHNLALDAMEPVETPNEVWLRFKRILGTSEPVIEGPIFKNRSVTIYGGLTFSLAVMAFDENAKGIKLATWRDGGWNLRGNTFADLTPKLNVISLSPYAPRESFLSSPAINN